MPDTLRILPRLYGLKAVVALEGIETVLLGTIGKYGVEVSKQ